MNKPYTFGPSVCMWCEKEYTPTSGRQLYCQACKGPAYRAKAMTWWKANGREYDREYKRNRRVSPHQQAKYTMNEIIEKTAFLKNMRARVKAQRGDMVSIKKIVRFVLKEMGIESVSYGAKKNCYRATEDLIINEFGGVCYGISDYGGIVFKMSKEKMT